MALKGFLSNFSILTCVGIVLILSVELILAIFSIAPPSTYFPETNTIDLPGELSPNSNSIEYDKMGKPYKVSVNELGFRNTGKIIENPKKKILCLGDSFTHGLVDDKHTYPYILQDLVTHKSLQVFNAGRPGYTLEDELSYLEEKGLSINPDIVILAFCKNDFTDYAEFWRKSFKRAGSGKWREQKVRNFFKRNSRILALAKMTKIQLVKFKSGSKEIRNVAFDINKEDFHLSKISNIELEKFRAQYASDFEKLYQLCQKHGVTIFPIIFPSPVQIKKIEGLGDQEFLKQLFESYHINYIDLYPHLNSYPVDSLFIPGDGHPTEFTNTIVAKLIAESLDSLKVPNKI